MKKALSLVVVLAVTALAHGCASEVATTAPPSSLTTSTAPVTATASPPSTEATTTTVPPTTFIAELSGAEVVPAVETLASGSATFIVQADGSRAYFKLTLSNIDDVIASRVHEGKPGVNGPGVLILYPGPTVSGAFTGVLAQGRFDASVLIGSLTGKTLADFAVLLQSGRAYVNVGTTKNPQGEIRGQIRQETP